MAGWSTVEIEQINDFDLRDGDNDCELHDVEIKRMKGFNSCDGDNDCELHDVEIKQINQFNSRDDDDDYELHDVEFKRMKGFNSRDGDNDCELHDVEIKQINEFDSRDDENDCELHDVEIKQMKGFDSRDGDDNCELHDVEIKQIEGFDSRDSDNDCELHDVEIKQINNFDSLDDGNDCNLHDVEIKQMPNFDLHVNYDSTHNCVERLWALFDEAHLCFLNEDSKNKNGKKPIPALLSDGEQLDLFKIFWAVWNRGGYDFVSKNGLWGSVAKEYGIDCRIFKESIKSVSLKYLSELDRLLRNAINNKSFKMEKDKIGKIGLLLLELQKEFSGIFHKERRPKRKNSKVVVVEEKIDGKFYDAKIEYADELLEFVGENSKEKEGCSKKKNGEISVFGQYNNGIYHDVDIVYAEAVFESVENSQKTINYDDDKKFDAIKGKSEFKKRKREQQCAKTKNGLHSDVDIVYLEKEFDIVKNCQKISNDDNDENNCLVGGESDSKKRKHNSISLSGMLDWVVQVAKHPDDVAIGRIPDCSKWKDHKRDDLWAQTLLAREALLRIKTTEDSRKNCKMHPLMFEDKNNLTPQSTKKLRSSERLNLVTKSRICPSSSTVHKNVASTIKIEIKDNFKKQSHPDIKILETNRIKCLSEEVKSPKTIPVGPFFQAKLPEWTGVASESDSKWLGTRMWPPQNEKLFYDFEFNSIGNGRKEVCLCQYPSSVPCVRFHIAENRMQLRCEIGLLFYHWKFHLMGEEVSLSWTSDEENRFKSIVRSNLPNPNRQFWGDIAKFFPDKTKEKLVSYYFNVFLIGRRAYQNRVTPIDIDSDDDDESEFGCVGGRFGIEAPNFRGSGGPICIENKQQLDISA